MKPYIEQAIRFLKRWSIENYFLSFGAICCLLIVLQVGGCSVNRIRGALLMRSLDEIKSPPVRKIDDAILAKYDGIVKSGLLGKPPAEGGTAQPVKAVGILGDAVLIGKTADDAKPFRIGAEVPDAGKLVEIGTDRVVVEKDGKKKIILVFPAGKPDAPAPENKPAKEPEKKGGPPAGPGAEAPKPPRPPGGPSEAPAHE